MAAKTKRPGTIAEAIKTERLERGWSQSQLARRLDVPETNVRNWERGRTEPRFSLYARMCLLFGWELPYASTPGKRATPEKLTRPVRGMPVPTEVLAAAGG
jgi:transcriptional regulator with XRE-family HTH domain